jgi:hypothetical protein
VELVERPLLVGHGLVVLPRLGDHHQDGVRERAAAEVQQLQRLIEAAGVRRLGRADREGAVEAGDQLGAQ